MVDDATLRAHLTAELGLDVEELEPLGVTAYNKHYRLAFGGRTMHLVAYNLPEELPLMGIRFEHAILRALQDAGYAEVPAMFVHDGESLFRVEDTFYAITEWIDGCHDVMDLELSPAQLADAARALADLHRCTAGLDMHLDYFPEHIFVYPAADFLDQHAALLDRIAGIVRGDADRFGAEALAALEAFLPLARQFLGGFDRELYDRVRAADPTGIVHGDFRRMNVVFTDDGVSRVLDYNCCFNEIRLWDVCYGALSAAGKETVGPVTDLDQAAAFVRAYHAAAPLSEDELALLPSFLTFVLVKLMTGAWEGWWLTDRIDTLRSFLAGDAEEIVRRALA